VISRRTLLALPLAAACTRPQEGFRGYAFVANQDGGAIAAVDLGALAVARHIPLEGAPTEITAAAERPSQRQAPKIGRNDPCPCGSGKKFKQCHGAVLEDASA